VEADILQAAFFDGGQGFDDAIFERFAADEANIRMGCGLMDKVLGTAEADFEPDLFYGHGEERRKGRDGWSSQIDTQAGQGLIPQGLLTGTRLAGALAAEGAEFIALAVVGLGGHLAVISKETAAEGIFRGRMSLFNVLKPQP
jgi:hypothetical protein